MLNRIVLMGILLVPLLVVLCSAVPAGWKTYFVPSSAFSISYPADYSVNEAVIEEQGKGIHAINFTIPERMVKGTNLSPDTRLSLEVLSGPTVCTPDLFLDSVTGYYLERQGPITFNVAKSGDAGAGNFYENDVFAIAGSKPCVAVRYFIHSRNIMNYDPGSVRPFDAAALTREFDLIRKTLVVVHPR